MKVSVPRRIWVSGNVREPGGHVSWYHLLAGAGGMTELVGYAAAVIALVSPPVGRGTQVGDHGEPPQSERLHLRLAAFRPASAPPTTARYPLRIHRAQNNLCPTHVACTTMQASWCTNAVPVTTNTTIRDSSYPYLWFSMYL